MKNVFSILQMIIPESQDIAFLLTILNRYSSFFLNYRTSYLLIMYNDIKFFYTLLSINILTSILFYIAGYINIFQYFDFLYCFVIIVKVLYFFFIYYLLINELGISLSINRRIQLAYTPFLSFYTRCFFEILDFLLNIILEVFSGFKSLAKSKTTL